MSESTPNTIEETQNIASRIRDNIGAFEHALDISPGDEEILDILTQIDALIEERILHLLYEEPRSLEGKSREQIETEIIDKALSGTHTSTRGSVYHLLEITCDRLYTLTEQTDFQSILERLNILHLQTEQVILPPDELHRPTLSGESSGESFERPSFPKLGHLIQLLREHEIYTDDLVILSGIGRENQMRPESYLLIEIPRLQRSVLLCNSYGEASFVYQGILPRERAWTLTKTQLQEQSKNRLIKISYSDEHIDRWRAEMTAALFQTNPPEDDPHTDILPPNPPGEKINVRECEDYRTEILQCYHTPDEWMQIPQSERLKFKVRGKGLNALARIFKARGNPIGTLKEMATLGRKIYGEGYEIIECEFWTPEQWKLKVLERYPTPGEWMQMNQKEKMEFKINEKGLTILSTIFGVTGKPIANAKDMASLGKMIYGEGYEILECELWSPEQWKEKIFEVHPTPETWMEMTAFEKLKFKVHGRGLTALARIFKARGNPINISKDMASLGKMIYGEGYEILERELWTSEQWKLKVLETCPTPNTWMQMNQKEKTKFKVHERGLNALATIFGLSGDPVVSSKDMAALGKMIYGEDQEVIECELWTSEQWKLKVLEACPTPNTWMQMNQKEKIKFKVHGKGLVVIARIFGLTGNPIDNEKDMASLGKMIYGEGYEILEHELWTTEQWKERILEKVPTSKNWMEMKKEEKTNFKIHDKGLKAVATIFGVSGKPVGNSKDMAMLGRAIYGNDPIFEKYIPAPIEETTES
jgi:hypothetical protein